MCVPCVMMCRFRVAPVTHHHSLSRYKHDSSPRTSYHRPSEKTEDTTNRQQGEWSRSYAGGAAAFWLGCGFEYVRVFQDEREEKRAEKAAGLLRVLSFSPPLCVGVSLAPRGRRDLRRQLMLSLHPVDRRDNISCMHQKIPRTTRSQTSTRPAFKPRLLLFYRHTTSLCWNPSIDCGRPKQSNARKKLVAWGSAPGSLNPDSLFHFPSPRAMNSTTAYYRLNTRGIQKSLVCGP